MLPTVLFRHGFIMDKLWGAHLENLGATEQTHY
jgi:hypothetical protein